MVVKNCLDEYFELMRRKPWLFEIPGNRPIVTDRAVLEKFTFETGITLGVIYKSNYNCFVVDLIDDGGTLIAYERIIPSADGRGVVCIPVCDGRFILIRQFRHAIREEQICFPRGFGEDGLESTENAKKELFEEIGAVASSVEMIGEIISDSGLSSGRCDVFLCHIDDFDREKRTEGIIETVACLPDELRNMISSGKINDSFTLSSFMLLESKNKIK